MAVVVILNQHSQNRRFEPAGMFSCVVRWVVLDMMRDFSALIFIGTT